MEIIEASSRQQLDQVRELFSEYWRAFDFSPCFQDFADEVAGLPGDYAPQRGRLALALVDGTPAGCIALRPLTDTACEMKRLYVRDAFRGHGTGIALVRWLIDQARNAGYTHLYADTMPVMSRALAMYERLGFSRTEPYSSTATDGAIYLSLTL
jgi:GNAT superfamily N-acetyltransferase